MPFYVGSEPDVGSTKNERRVALVIGNSAYRHSSELANPVNDAKAVAAVLTRLGFDVVQGLDLDLRAMGDVQEAFEAKLRSKPDIALLYYAGHGLQVRGLNYLVPIDAQIEAQAHLSTRAVRFNDVFDPMAEEAGASLIFLDACRDNPFTCNLARNLGEGARSAAIRGGLARIEKVAGTFIAYATAPDTVAFDGKGQNSPFTAAVLKHIETPGLSVSDMMIDVRNSVIAETQGRQEPWDQSSLRARFSFVPKIEEPEAEIPAQRIQMSGPADEWAAIQHTTSLALLARFKERHADPPWSEYADIRATELREADEARRKALEEAKRHEKTKAAAASQAISVSTRERPLPRKPSAQHGEVPSPEVKPAKAETASAPASDNGTARHAASNFTDRERNFYRIAGAVFVVLVLLLLMPNIWGLAFGGVFALVGGAILGLYRQQKKASAELAAKQSTFQELRDPDIKAAGLELKPNERQTGIGADHDSLAAKRPKFSKRELAFYKGVGAVFVVIVLTLLFMGGR